MAASDAQPRIPSAGLAVGERLQAIDVLRGLVILLMALDHVRDYFHNQVYLFDPLDLDQSYPLLYATRWITHFCAPTFVFLSGVSAFLQSAKGKTGGALSRFLLTRGLWLVFLELTLVNFGWTFTPTGMVLIQVIWAIGWSMVALAGLVFLPRVAVLAIGVAIVAGHNLLDPIQAQSLGAWAPVWYFLHQQTPVMIGDQFVALLAYPLLGWFGIMALGYGLGGIFIEPPARRDRTLILLGAGMLALFVALRFGNFYGDPQPWTAQGDTARDVMAFFNVRKNPPSLMYVCATLGTALLLFPALARLPKTIANFFAVFGCVPLFAYVLHLYVMHALAIGAAIATGRDAGYLIDPIRKMIFDAEAFAGTGFSLPVVYLFWLAVIAILYPLCVWFAGVKRTRRDWWLSYM
ncbi:MAG: heparan-alpha-glucosaminide N-acetyltransferase domain-containing protein [Terricaulis sp.]